MSELEILVPQVSYTNKEGRKSLLGLKKLKIEVEIISGLARTIMFMTFYNDLDRELEGELNFPLAEGQTVSYFALDIDGKLRDGVVVEKVKGRQVFEEIVRRNVDPGLLEQTKGNSFKTRIYPIFSKNSREIAVGFEEELKLSEDSYEYHLPLNFKDRVDSLEIQIKVQNDSSPETLNGKNYNLDFNANGKSHIASLSKENIIPDQDIFFRVVKRSNQNNIYVSQKNDVDYFYLNIEPTIQTSDKTLPTNIALFWDISNSSSGRNIEKELAILDGYINKIGNLTIELILFSYDIDDSIFYQIKDGDWSELYDHLKNVVYDGGTQLGAIYLNRYTCDEVILSTDGISNFGESELKLSDTPIIVMNSSKTAEHSYLNSIADRTGGVYLNLNKIEYDEAQNLLTNQPFRFMGAQFNHNEIEDCYPSDYCIVSKDFSFTGKLLSGQGELKLNFGIGNQISYSETLSINKEIHDCKSMMIPRLWASKKIAELDKNFKANEEEITELGKEFTIVTRNSSLIVLEEINDYVKNRIVPPEELQEEYYKLVNEELEKNKQFEEEHLDNIYDLFKDHIDWCEKDFQNIEYHDLNIDTTYIDELDDTGILTDSETIEETIDNEESGSERLNLFSDSSDEIAYDRPQLSTDRRRRLTENDMSPLFKSFESAIPGGSVNDEDIIEKQHEATIQLKKWEPDAPYIEELKQYDQALGFFEKYLDFKKKYSNSSAFFLDVADLFLEKDSKEKAVQVLSNIAEMELENHQLLRILGYRLLQLGYTNYAITIFQEVLRLREEEPQSYRDLGLAYRADGQYQKAIDLLYEVVRKEWDRRFPEIQLVALHELNAIIATCGENLKTEDMDQRLLVNLPVDMRVVLTWDADNCDIDLWVTDPYNEKCYYENKLTESGGRMSPDFTQGYGPEVFMIKKAPEGKYLVEVNYFGNSQQIISGSTTIQVDLITNFGKLEEKQESITLRLEKEKQVIKVGELYFK